MFRRRSITRFFGKKVRLRVLVRSGWPSAMGTFSLLATKTTGSDLDPDDGVSGSFFLARHSLGQKGRRNSLISDIEDIDDKWTVFSYIINLGGGGSDHVLILLMHGEVGVQV